MVLRQRPSDGANGSTTASCSTNKAPKGQQSQAAQPPDPKATALAEAAGAPMAPEDPNNNLHKAVHQHPPPRLTQPTTEPLSMMEACFCARFLNPFNFPYGSGNNLVVPKNLQHYCRVCNTQLNSCVQAKIHSQGKKHDKRVSYLRFCLESSDVGLVPAPGPLGGFGTPAISAAPATALAISAADSTALATVPPPTHLIPTTVVESSPATGFVTYPTATTCAVTGASIYYPPPPAVPTLPPPPPTACNGQSITESAAAGYPTVPPPPVPPPSTIPSRNYYSPVAVPTTTVAAPGYPSANTSPGTYQYFTPYPEYSVVTSPLETSPTCELAPLPQLSLMQQPPPPLPPVAPPAAGQQAQYPQVVYNCNVMSPSLTSGFSGSGGDCKSTETSSILSAASYTSTAAIGPHLPASHSGGAANRQIGKKTKQGANAGANASQKEGNPAAGANTKKGGKNGKKESGGAHENAVLLQRTNSDGLTSVSKPEAAKTSAIVAESAENGKLNSTSEASNSTGITEFYCDVCQLYFPSAAVLENHLNGNRHARRVKSKEALKQLLDSGLIHFRHQEGVTEMRCEICKMSVNSSHQLQAHLQGQKHRVRAIKRGIGLKSGGKVVLPIVAPADSAATAAASLQAAATSSSLTSSSTGEMTSTHPSSEAGSSDDSAVVVQSTSPPTEVVGGGSGKRGKTKDEGPAVNRHRRSSALIPTSSNAKLEKAKRHGSSGCLSKHCSYSSLQLQELNGRSSSSGSSCSSNGLNKLQSRSMNLLTIAASSVASAKAASAAKVAAAAGRLPLSTDSSSTDEGFDPDSERQKKTKSQRPRSYSTRVAKEQADASSVATKSPESNNNLTTKHNVQPRSPTNSQQNGTVFNGTSSKAPPKNSDKKSGKEGNDNNKKVSSMLGVFLEGLTNGKDSSQTGKNKKQKNENKKQQQEAAAGKAALTAAS